MINDQYPETKSLSESEYETLRKILGFDDVAVLLAANSAGKEVIYHTPEAIITIDDERFRWENVMIDKIEKTGSAAFIYFITTERRRCIKIIKDGREVHVHFN